MAPSRRRASSGSGGSRGRPHGAPGWRWTTPTQPLYREPPGSADIRLGRCTGGATTETRRSSVVASADERPSAIWCSRIPAKCRWMAPMARCLTTGRPPPHQTGSMGVARRGPDWRANSLAPPTAGPCVACCRRYALPLVGGARSRRQGYPRTMVSSVPGRSSGNHVSGCRCGATLVRLRSVPFTPIAARAVAGVDLHR
jgi:hypothetical protein